MYLDDTMMLGRWRETTGELPEELSHLPECQLEALAWVWRYWVAHRYGPAHREIAAGLGSSSRTATAAPFVDPLMAEGYLERTLVTPPGRPTRRECISICEITRAVQKLSFEGIVPSKKEAEPTSSE